MAPSVCPAACFHRSVTHPPPQPNPQPHTYFSWHLFSARQPIRREPRDVNQRRRNAKDITIYSFSPSGVTASASSFPVACQSIHFLAGGWERSLGRWGFEIVVARGGRRRAAPVSSSLLGLWFPLTDPPTRPPRVFPSIHPYYSPSPPPEHPLSPLYIHLYERISIYTYIFLNSLCVSV